MKHSESSSEGVGRLLPERLQKPKGGVKMRKYEVTTAVESLRKEVVVIMVRDETTMAIATKLKEEVPNLQIVDNSSELSEIIESHLTSSDVFVVTDVTYKFIRSADEPDVNITWVGCRVYTNILPIQM